MNAIIEGCQLDVWPSAVYTGGVANVRIRSQEGSPEGEDGWYWRIDVTRGLDGQDVAQTLELPLASGEHGTSIDPSALAEGVYRIRPSLIAPSGETRRVWHRPDAPRPSYVIERFLSVHHRDAPCIDSRIVDRAGLLTELKLLGNPGKARYPSDSASDSHGRSVWDLELHGGRIFVGLGDGGPIEIWSFDPRTLALEVETTVDEETVTIIRSIGDRLYVPGINATESWEFGNIYIRDASGWHKHRTVPNGIHVLGIVRHRDKLFVTTGTEPGPALFESNDEGLTWKRYGVNEDNGRWDWRFYEVGVLGDGLLLTVLQEYFYHFQDGALRRVVSPVFPGLEEEYTAPFRLTAFRSGLLYAAGEWWETGSPKPLYFISDVDAGARVVSGFGDRSVRDIVVRGDLCYVLTSTRADDTYVGEIFSTYELKEWTRLAIFQSDAMAQSMEVSDGRFFIGMATLRDVSSPEAGDIYELLPAQ